MFKLVISDDEGKTTVVPLVRDEITVGRADGNTIRLTERNVSRQHAILRRDNGAFVVEDLGSYNGTSINGERIEARVPVQAGDELRIGDYVLALHVDSTEITEDSVSRARPEDRVLPARLVMITPPVPGAEFALSRPMMRLGRSADLDIWINHRSISREHAEVNREEDGSFHILDLGSANGIRINGEEVEEAVLEPYDVLKLGRVRLRYIPEGEDYVFDPAAESEDDDANFDGEPRPSRAPLYLAVGIVLAALLIGAAIITYAGMISPQADGQDSVTSILPTAQVAPTAAATLAAVDAGVVHLPTPQQRGAACRQALRDGHFQEAVEDADAALRLAPDDADFADCRAKGVAGVDFEKGFRALQDGDVDGAYAAFAEIPPDSPFRQHPSVAQAAQKFAAAHVAQARALSASDPKEALRQVDMVLGMTDAPVAQKARAERLRRMLHLGRAGRKRSTAPRPVPRNGAGGAADGAPQPSPLDRALDCARRGENACVVSELEGKATTARGLALLIETYRAMGRTDAAVRNMRLFLQRYPGDRRAAGYQELLTNQR